ncbi:helix-turn-helix domain-containing protein [Streptomyces sp. NPDC048641]|uniref:helix-turn-helix domain-containing protein n=1 Tax=Streptomyces sp. NPDC048641 TaxID=3154825 RepID=UPI0034245A7C
MPSFSLSGATRTKALLGRSVRSLWRSSASLAVLSSIRPRPAGRGAGEGSHSAARSPRRAARQFPAGNGPQAWLSGRHGRVTTQAEPTEPVTGSVETGTRAGPSGRAARDGLGDALREWRVRRRVSQLELATRAGTTQRHVSFVESGRSVPGRAMVVRLAEALKVPLRERNALLLATDYAPAYQESHYGGPQLSAVRTALERVMAAHLPHSAVIIDQRGDLVSCNEAFDALTEGVAPALLSSPVNIARAAASARPRAADREPGRVGLARHRRSA